MKILLIGDVFGRIGRDMLFEQYDQGYFGADVVIANAENAAHGRGITKQVYEELLKTGIDGFTMGNHTWDCPDALNILKFNDNIIRPYNLEGSVPGSGTMIIKGKNGVNVGVINLLGRVNVQPPSANPFICVNRAIEALKKKCDIIVVDFHAEATSEKLALGYYLDSRVSIVAGTHTHVQTSDEQILPGGCGYITDLGMTGPAVSVLGMDKNIIIDRFINGLPKRFEPAGGNGQFSACLFEIDENTAKCVKVERIFIRK